MNSHLPVTPPAPGSLPTVGGTILNERFTLREMLSEEVAGSGAPAVWLADGTGASFVAKLWTRRPYDDEAVRTIWNHEVRSLLRLDGLPRAHEHFAGLEALGSDDAGFYIVVDGGGRSLLSEALSERNRHEWLRRPEQARVRLGMWRGLQRLAAALAILHDQGVLHRALTAGCVFTDRAGECDFRLSGFEWSLRLSAAAHGGRIGAGPKRMRAPELASDEAVYSVASDWFDFGLIAVELLAGLRAEDVGLDALFNLRNSIAASRILTEPERRMLLGLLLPNPDRRRLECVDLPRRIAAMASQLALGQGAGSKALILAVHLGSGNSLVDAIIQVSDQPISRQDVQAQIAFIEEDLRSNATVLVRRGQVPSYAIHGRQLSYRVQKLSQRSGSETWRAAFCSTVDSGARQRGRSETMVGWSVSVGTVNQVEQRMRDPRQRSTAWDQAFPFDAFSWDAPGGDAYDFLRFTNTVDALMSASRIWPIVVVGQGRGQGADGDWVEVEAAKDEDRDAMARCLGLESTARQIEAAFVDEIGQVEPETVFNIVDGPALRCKRPTKSHRPDENSRGL